MEQLTISEPSYYYREFDNDFSETSYTNTWLEQAKRISLVTLPFFSLYKPLSFPLSLAMGGIRVFSCSSELIRYVIEGNLSAIAFSLLQTSIAIVALASTIFAHPLGMIITSVQDIVIESLHLIQHLQNGDYKKALISCLSVINNILYLTLFLKGGIAITIASLAMQILLGIIHLLDDFQNGRYLEGTGHLLMSMVRGNQLIGHVKFLQDTHRFEKTMSKLNSNKSHEKEFVVHTIREEKEQELLNLDMGIDNTKNRNQISERQEIRPSKQLTDQVQEICIPDDQKIMSSTSEKKLDIKAPLENSIKTEIHQEQKKTNIRILENPTSGNVQSNREIPSIERTIQQIEEPLLKANKEKIKITFVNECKEEIKQELKNSNIKLQNSSKSLKNRDQIPLKQEISSSERLSELKQDIDDFDSQKIVSTLSENKPDVKESFANSIREEIWQESDISISKSSINTDFLLNQEIPPIELRATPIEEFFLSENKFDIKNPILSSINEEIKSELNNLEIGLQNNSKNIDQVSQKQDIRLSAQIVKSVEKIYTSDLQKNTQELIEITPSELQKMVGMPFLFSQEESFKIHDKNLNGETVGVAYFGNNPNQQIAWYWHPNTGFEIVADINKIIAGDQKISQIYHASSTFQFNSKLSINNKGILSGTFQIINPGISKNTGYGEWFTWSKNEGLKINPPMYNHLHFGELNDLGDVLLFNNNQPIITNINNPENLRYFSAPTNEMEEIVTNWAKTNQIMKIQKNPWNKNYFFSCISSNYKLNEDSSITGESSIRFYGLPQGTPDHKFNIHFELDKNLKIISNCISKVTCISCNGYHSKN